MSLKGSPVSSRLLM